ncbi:MAG TPA: glutamate--cysteine ligase [Abditibacteriaceae bacterium]|jgi:carboxylate-amine ligase
MSTVENDRTSGKGLSENRWTIGVEEEFQIVDRATRALLPHGARIVADAQHAVGEAAQHELFLAQIETGTPICRTLGDVREQLIRLRRAVIEAAQSDGGEIAAAGTHPFSLVDEQPIAPKARYLGLADLYQQLTREHLICGCHVHVGVNDRELAIQIMNRARGWLAPLIALAANSPYWEGEETGYASFRTEVWRRWPMAGSPHPFRNRAEYETLTRTLVETGAIADETRIYWDIRPADRFETLEFRATDVCLTVDEAVMIAGLCRSLARKLAADVEQDAQREAVYIAVRPELLRAAEWGAARYGLEENLIDVHAGRAVPAAENVETLLQFLRDDLEDYGDWDEVSTLVREVLVRGNGAQRQRMALEKRGEWSDVVDLVVAETARGL